MMATRSGTSSEETVLSAAFAAVLAAFAFLAGFGAPGRGWNLAAAASST